MSLGTDIAGYLASTSLGLGLTLGSSSAGGVFGVPFPPEAADQATCIVRYGGEPPLESFGPSLLPGIVIERPRFQVISRDLADNTAALIALSTNIYLNLRHFNGVIGTTTYAFIKPLSPPFFLGFDENLRPQYACNFGALKGES